MSTEPQPQAATTDSPSSVPASPSPGSAPGSAGHVDLVEKYFDDNAQDWSELYGKAKRVNDLVLAARRDAAVAQLDKHTAPGSRLLDAGCGAGLTALELVRRGHTVDLIDVSSQMLGYAQKNLEDANVPEERYRLLRGDPATSEELQRESYDGIAALGFLQYQKDEGVLLRRMHDLLRPDGTLVITGPTKTRLADWFGFSKVYAKAQRKLARKKPQRTFTDEEIAKAREAAESRKLLHTISAHAYSFGRFRELLEKANFEVVDQRGHGFVNFAIIGPKLGFKGELFLHRFFTGASKVLPISRFANDLIVVARKR